MKKQGVVLFHLGKLTNRIIKKPTCIVGFFTL
jgi:hypothetical protein